MFIFMFMFMFIFIFIFMFGLGFGPRIFCILCIFCIFCICGIGWFIGPEIYPKFGFCEWNVLTKFRSASGGDICGFCCENWNSVCIWEIVSAT